MSSPWPWYIAGPLIGLIVPMLLLFGGKVFGLSSNLRHACAAVPLPSKAKPDFLRYNWLRTGGWNMMFALGIALGGILSVVLLGVPNTGDSISDATQADLAGLGISDFSGLVPAELFSWQTLMSPLGILLIVGGGFFVGFGARYAGGCTSGHAISGLADLQLPSLVAVIGFFVGGLFVTFILLPLLLG
jgi:uncharacterized protein